MGLFGQTSTPTAPPAVTYVRVQPFEMKAAEWSLQAIVFYVLLRDFFMYVVPFVVGRLYTWVHATFPKAEQLVVEEFEEVLESASGVVDKVGGAAATAVGGALAHVQEELEEAASKGSAGLVAHVQEELLEAASKGGAGLMSRLVEELVS